MRLSLLEKREDVLSVITDTLNSIFSNTITFYKNKPESDDYIVYYGNKYFNYFATKKTSKKAFQVILKEYSKARSTSLIRQMLQKGYVNLATRKLFYSLFYHYKLYAVTREDNPVGGALVMGGNSRIRLIFANQNRTQVILKTNYPRDFINNEINIRQTLGNRDFIPRLIDFDKTSFTESLHPGFPINRLEKRLYKKSKNEAFEKLETLQKEYITLSATYTQQLLQSIQQRLPDSLDTNWLNNLKIPQGISVPVTISHGDFQAANILDTNDGLKIIDWESAKMRSKFYDDITLNCDVREAFDSITIRNYIEKHIRSNMSSKQVFKLYALEELAYQLDYIDMYKIDNKAEIKKIENLISTLNTIDGPN